MKALNTNTFATLFMSNLSVAMMKYWLLAVVVESSMLALAVYFVPAAYRADLSLAYVALSVFSLIAVVSLARAAQLKIGEYFRIDRKLAFKMVAACASFAAVLLLTPSYSYAESLNDMLARQAAAGQQQGRTLEQGPGWHRVYKTIYTVGKTADGKYNVYNVTGDLDDFNFKAGNAMYSERDVIKYLNAVDAKDVGKTVKCYTICKNAAGQVVGVNPSYKK